MKTFFSYSCRKSHQAKTTQTHSNVGNQNAENVARLYSLCARVALLRKPANSIHVQNEKKEREYLKNEHTYTLYALIYSKCNAFNSMDFGGVAGRRLEQNLVVVLIVRR